MPGSHRLLFLLHCTPGVGAIHGGGRLIAHLLAGMAERHKVAVVHLRDLGEPGMAAELRAKCDLVVEVPRAEGARHFLGRALHRLRVMGAPVIGLPMWAAHLPGRRFARRVSEVADSWRPDIVQLEFSVMGRYLPALRRCDAGRILSHHMPGSDAVHRTSGLGGAWSRPDVALDLLAWDRFERRVMRQVDAVVTFTEDDRRTIARQAGVTPVHTISIGAALPDVALDPAGSSRDIVLFVGNYGHPPNRDGAVRLAQDILPLVRQRRPQARLCLVGASPEWLDGLGGEHIDLVGQVPDVTPYLNAAAVVAAPLRQGGGIRIKVLETLAAGKALVASRRALQGIAVRDREEVMVAESDREFADRIVELLANEQLRVALASRARRWAEANLGWSKTLDAYEALYDGYASVHRPQDLPD
jgi:polysaccharide biosynthesis protein PslH